MREYKIHHREHARDSEYQRSNRSFRNVFKTLTKAHDGKTNIARLYSEEKADIMHVLTNELSLKKFLKISIVLILSVIKVNEVGETMDMMVIPFRGNTFEAGLNMDELEDNLDDRFRSIISRFQDFSEHGSNWVMDEVLETRLELTETQSLNGGCGFTKSNFLEGCEERDTKS